MVNRPFAEFRIDTTLDDREHNLIVPVQRLGLTEMLEITLKPSLSQFKRLGSVLFVSVTWTALVKRHHYVSADNSLGVNVILWSKSVPRTINVRLETATLLGDFSDFGQREHLESAAVRQDRSVPVLKLVKSADLFQGVETRPQIEMIGVAKDDLGLHILLQVPVIDPFDGAYRPDRHEYRSPHLTMIGGENACPCP